MKKLTALLLAVLMVCITLSAFASTATFIVDGETYTTIEFEDDSRITPPDSPVKEGYVFGGWTMEDGAKAYKESTKLSGDVEITAWFQKVYTFEAEKTQLTGLDYDCEENFVYDTVTEGGMKIGVVLSGSSNGTMMIASSDKASNGQYVAGIDYKGAYLDFEFTSDKAESGALLKMKLSARFRKLVMSATDNANKVEILVNGTAVNYDDITIDRPDNASDMSGEDCENYFTECYIGNIDIQEGDNLIRIYINNDNGRPDGTVKAMAPVVDCIYVYSSAELTPVEYENK